MGCFYLKGSGLRRSSKHFSFWVQRAPRALPSSRASSGVWRRGRVSAETWVGCAGDLRASWPRCPRVSFWVHMRPCVPAGFLAPLEPGPPSTGFLVCETGPPRVSQACEDQEGWPTTPWRGPGLTDGRSRCPASRPASACGFEGHGEGLSLCSLTPVMWRRTSSGHL